MFFFFLLKHPSYSQGGSSYSIFGIGDIIHNSSAIYDGLGTTAIAVPSEHSINLVNPALWGKLTQTRIRGGYRFNQNLIRTEENRLFQNNGKVDAILYGFAIDTSIGATIAFGFNTYSTVNYYIARKVYVSVDDYSLKSEDVYLGSGGISQAFLGGSYRPINWFYFGSSILADFGTINSSIKNYVSGANASSAYTEKIDYFIGMGFRIGALFEITNQLRIGSNIEIHTPTKLTRNTRYIYELTTDTTFETNGSIHLPFTFGIGASFLSGKFLFASDLIFQDFSNLNYNLSPRANFGTQTKISFGVSRIRNKSYYAQFIDKITYNFGIYYKKLYIEIDNNSIKEFAGSFGFEIPIVGSAILDAGFVFGARLPSVNSLPKEYFGRMILEFSMGERWFVPFRRD
ncbi:MAG: hypothetical protein ACUVQ1_03885 [Candidatus Kapaibacteriales bacterium]